MTMRFDFSFGASNPLGNTKECTNNPVREINFLRYHPEAFSSAWREGHEFNKEDGARYISMLVESSSNFLADIEFRSQKSGGKPEKVREIKVHEGINDIFMDIPELSSNLKEIVLTVWRCKNEKLGGTKLTFSNFVIM